MLIAELTLSTAILKRALATAPEVTVSLDQQYTRDTDTSLLQIQATGDGLTAFDTALPDDPTVADAALLGEDDGWRQYRLTLSPAGDDASTYHMRTELDAVLLDAEATTDGWTLRLQFPDRASVSAYRQRCVDAGISFRLHRLYEKSPHGRTQYGLTAPQEAVLTAAFEAGYFEVPRRCSLADIGDELGISGQATSERLRRGLQTLLRSTLSEQNSPEEVAAQPTRDAETPDRPAD
ncbi:hypothetical protein AUR64_08145 [Haloprofundus marisrubri]|uniref:Bacterio-opsin activator n=1 Tax=Haloprofundus marisrubri TaxID=1514971 RepID=A0A0W1RB98_9EURY|nr:helix-turn-helix domain-containing protein [Haloprofundus marisrubri]KTG10626.1 hypothetical protein AUR64_08145 [Haloprofundus marisrubri]